MLDFTPARQKSKCHMMAWATLVFLNLVFLATAHIPVPFSSNPRNGLNTPWSFNFSSPAPHYFSSINSLLKQWPQTFFPNGHVLAAGEIPAFTKLYHGRQDAESPPSPEWLAFDMYDLQHPKIFLTSFTRETNIF